MGSTMSRKLISKVLKALLKILVSEALEIVKFDETITLKIPASPRKLFPTNLERHKGTNWTGIVKLTRMVPVIQNLKNMIL
jgi:hypothetical protein